MTRLRAPRRGATVLLSLACAVAALALSAATWVSASVPDPLSAGTSAVQVTGGEAAPVVGALALVAAAAAVALSTARRALLTASAALLALAGAGALVAALAVVLDPGSVLSSAAESASGTTGAPPRDVHLAIAPVVALVPALGLVGCGAWALVSGRRWTASARFERDAGAPAASAPRASGSAPESAGASSVRPTTAPGSPGEGPAAPPRLWDDLSSGEDPTR